MEVMLFAISPILALVASSFVIAVIRFLDVLEREPWWAIAITFLLGLATVVPAIVLGSIAQLLWSIVLGDAAPLEFLQIVVDAPVVEELVKALALLIVLLMLRREMDSLTDFIVYACVVAVAFEFCENTLYLWSRLSTEDGAVAAWLMEFNARTIASAGMHAMFTAWSGFGLWCLVCQRGLVRWGLAPLAFLMSVLMHALNNLSAYMANVGEPGVMSTLNYAGQSIGMVSNILQMGFFLALIGSAILQDLHVLSSFGLALQMSLQRMDPPSPQAMQRLHCFLNPFHHLVAHSWMTWRCSRLARQSPVARPEYARFAKAALKHQENRAAADGDLATGLALLMPIESPI